MAISDSYYKSRSRKRRLGLGGPLTPEEQAKQDATMGTVGMGAGLAGGLVDAIATPNQYGRVSTGGMAASGALKGAAAGASLGPIGAAAGAVIGGVTGLIAGGKAKRAEEQMVYDNKVQTTLDEQAAMNARLKSDPTLSTGSLSAQYFATGGFLGGGDDKPTAVKATKGRLTTDQLTEFANYSGKPGGVADVTDYNKKLDEYGLKGAEYLRQPYGRDISQPDNLRRVQQHWLGATTAQALSRARELNIPASPEAFAANKELIFGKDRYADAILKDPNFARMYPNYMDVVSRLYKDRYNEYEPSSNLVKRANGGPIPTTSTQAVGGKLVPQSSDGVEVQGNTHAEGGVQIPGAEVEGGETIKDNFVYSAQLGFAQKSKPLMRAKGKIEQKPATADRINALKRIEDKENQLAIAQEYLKKTYGLK